MDLPGKFPLALSSILAAGLFSTAALRAQPQLGPALEAFYSPAAALFSPDGHVLYVANAARGEYGMIAGRGAISRVRVNDDGEMTIEAARLVDGLNAPLGLAWLGGDTQTFPAGALVAAVGGSWTVDDKGRPVSPQKRRPGLAFFDAETGKELGTIYLGAGSPLAKVLGHPLIDPNALAADGAGNVFIADVAGSGLRQLAPGEGQPGVLKLSPAAIDALARNEVPPPDSALFAPVFHIPTGVAYDRRDQSLYWVTGNGFGDIGGAVFRLPRADFSGGTDLETVAKKLNALVGVAVTPGGTILAGRSDGSIVTVHERRGRRLKFKPEHEFLSIGQIATRQLPDGRVLVVVPELSGGGLGAWRQRLQTFFLQEES